MLRLVDPMPPCSQDKLIGIDIPWQMGYSEAISASLSSTAESAFRVTSPERPPAALPPPQLR